MILSSAETVRRGAQGWRISWVGNSVVHETTAMKIMKVFIVGTSGYVGSRIAQWCDTYGAQVRGTVRSKNIASQNPNKLFWFDGSEPLSETGKRALLESTHILDTAPPQGDGQSSLLHHHKNHLLSSTALEWASFLSSTGVYGDHQGGWITESSPFKPATAKAIARQCAEESWNEINKRIRCVHIFRLAGIYGPGRSALDMIDQAGGDYRAIPGVLDNVTMISRVHVDDIIQILSLSMLDPTPGGLLLNVADGQPSSRREVLTAAAALKGQQLLLTQDDTGQSKLFVSPREGGSRRVDSSAMQLWLRKHGHELIYADYNSGLVATLAVTSNVRH